MNDVRITFLGAANNVTGSRTLVEIGDFRLLVDCGMHQERPFRERDHKPFPVDPGTIDAVLLTHAHLDHCGLLPKLVHDGFSGPIYCTPVSAEVAGIVLKDAAWLQEEDIRYKRKRHNRQGKKAKFSYAPLYTVADAKATMPLLTRKRLEQSFEVTGGVRATFRNSGHILGSSFIRLEIDRGGETRSILFSGDVGRLDKPIIQDPQRSEQADYVDSITT